MVGATLDCACDASRESSAVVRREDEQCIGRGRAVCGTVHARAGAHHGDAGEARGLNRDEGEHCEAVSGFDLCGQGDSGHFRETSCPVGLVIESVKGEGFQKKERSIFALTRPWPNARTREWGKAGNGTKRAVISVIGGARVRVWRRPDGRGRNRAR